jgi:hypothetical protein
MVGWVSIPTPKVLPQPSLLATEIQNRAFGVFFYEARQPESGTRLPMEFTVPNEVVTLEDACRRHPDCDYIARSELYDGHVKRLAILVWRTAASLERRELVAMYWEKA